jgi:hypothetical protein
MSRCIRVSTLVLGLLVGSAVAEANPQQRRE